MKLVLDIASSIEFWRQRYPDDRAPEPSSSLTPTDCAFRQKDVLPLIPPWIDEEFLAPTAGMLHVLVLDGPRGRQRQFIATYSWRRPTPDGSFYELQDDVYVESPGFMFLQAATILSFSKLIAFGDELCGCYSFDKRKKRGFRKRKVPLVSKEELEHFVLQAVGCPGRKHALKALTHIVERSASPMETFDEMTMCLPAHYGGYAIPRLTMNRPIKLTEKAARIAQRNNCFLDMSYEDFPLDIEHHGKLDHSSDAEKESDFARVSGLKEMGYEVIELTHAQVADLFTYEYIIQRIARLLGKRIPKYALGATPERIKLRRELLEWNRSYGKIR